MVPFSRSTAQHVFLNVAQRELSRLRIVVVSTDAPDPLGNAAGRWYYVLAKGLCDRGHRVRWFAAYTSEAFAARARDRFAHSDLGLSLYPYPRRSLLASKWQSLRRPYSYFISKELANDVATELKHGYDILHLEQTWAGWLGIGVPRALHSIHWIAHVDLSPVSTKSLKHVVSGVAMKWTERHLIGRFENIRVLTQQDARMVRQLNPRARIDAVPLAIDPELYSFESREPSPLTVGLIGSMGWEPTRAAAVRLVTSVWPRVKAISPAARLLVVGWGARRALAKFLNEPDLTVVEDVPETVSYFRQLSVLAFPVYNASGMKVKVLEAMAYGVPVATTTEGIAGVEAVNGRDVIVADDDDVMAKRIAGLLEDPKARNAMSEAARFLVEQRHSPKAVLPQIEALYERILLQERRR